MKILRGLLYPITVLLISSADNTKKLAGSIDCYIIQDVPRLDYDKTYFHPSASLVSSPLIMARVARSALSVAVLLLTASAAAQTTAAPSTTAAPKPTITAVSDCHGHSTVKYVLPSSMSL
jgi:hypothetical protein